MRGPIRGDISISYGMSARSGKTFVRAAEKVRTLMSIGGLGWAVFQGAIPAANAEVKKPAVPVVLGQCMIEDDTLGVIPKPGCELKIRVPGGEFITAKTNALGLRDRDYTEMPAAGALRILVAGPALAAPNLRDEELPARQLEEKLKSLGHERVEVINGVVGEYRAPRNYLWTRRLIDAYQPHLLVYFQMGHNFAEDFHEYAQMKIGDNNAIERFMPPYYLQRVPGFIRRSWPQGRTFLRGWVENMAKVREYWRTYWASSSSRDYAHRFIFPSQWSLQLMRGKMGADRQMYVAWAPTAAHNGDAMRDVGNFLEGLFQLIVPKVFVNARELNEKFAMEASLRLAPMSTRFREGRRAGLIDGEPSYRVTAAGAALWAEGVAFYVSDYFKRERANTIAPVAPANKIRKKRS